MYIQPLTDEPRCSDLVGRFTATHISVSRPNLGQGVVTGTSPDLWGPSIGDSVMRFSCSRPGSDDTTLEHNDHLLPSVSS